MKIVRELALDGIVATNTSISREGLSTAKSKIEAVGNGGLSGAPLFDRSTQILRTLRAALGPGFVLIGTGGITDGATAVEKMRAGADLIQVYSGLIYRGPALVIEIKKALIEAGITG